MKKCIPFLRFMQKVFDSLQVARRAAEIAKAILEAKSLRMTEIAAHMPGSMDAAYKRLTRFLHQVDPRELLWRFCPPQAPFLIADPTEIERPQAYRTPYVGILKDGKTRGFVALILSTPYRGRAIPCGFVTYSSRTISEEEISRNLYHFRAFSAIKELLGERPLVLDREFSYEGLLEALVVEGIHFVIRLNLGSHPPKFYDQEGREVQLTIMPGETRAYRHLWYKGKVRVNIVGRWLPGLKEPLWVMTDLEPEKGLEIYSSRMKIEESFRDLKGLLGMERLMNKTQENMEKMIAFLLIVYAISLLVGENLRDYLYAEPQEASSSSSAKGTIPGKPNLRPGKKWRLYSGLFVLLRQKWHLSRREWQQLIQESLALFTALLASVPT
jgi:hypothetical protein